MLVYPFDPQCRLESNKISNEPLQAFPSSATRTLVPAHAPFFQEGCVVKKSGKELIEGVDFYFSLEHKVASAATAMRVYGGITLINDAIFLPLTIDYHLQGGSFEATPGQIRQYLDTAPDIWDGSWEALLGNTYYPPVKILYDPEAFVSEPAIIEACHEITNAIKAKDEKESISYQVYATRIRKLREQLEQIQVHAHMATRGNAHDTKPFHVGALGDKEAAANTKRLEGKDLEAFTEYVNSVLGDLSEAMADKVKQGEDFVTTTKFLLDGGTLELGESTSLSMDEDGITHIGDNALSIKADAKCLRPGIKASMYGGGGNLLTVESTGIAQDDKKLAVNDKEIVTTATLRAYVNSILSQTGYNFAQQKTATMYFAGAGIMTSPIEAIPTIPVGSETIDGIVKVVNEGSHGYPCPGYSSSLSYIFHDMDDKYVQLRNGADDLEHDVFYTYITLNPYTMTPTADRFRPAGLPVTAKPTYVYYGTEDCVWLQTTDGPFILLTGRNRDPDTWRCLKITNSNVPNGTPHLYNGKIYVVRSRLANDTSFVDMYEAPVTAANTLTFTARTISGNNFNGTPTTSLTFSFFDKIVGQYGDPKCMWYNKGDGVSSINVSHAGDPVTQVRNGDTIRVNHIGNMYAPSPTQEYRARQPLSYQLNLLTGALVPDNPGSFPIEISKAGYSHYNPRMSLAGGGGNNTAMGVVANGIMFLYDSYGSFYPPTTARLSPRAGVSLYDEIHAENQYWTRVAAIAQTGMYASAITTRPRGPRPLPNNRMMVECSNGQTVLFAYDPSGSYGPTVKGYGPTNDRVKWTNEAGDNLARICWVFDGDTIRHEGGWLTDGLLSTYSTFENDEFGGIISMDAAVHAALKTQAINKYAAAVSATMVDSRLSLMVHRRSGLPMLGQLQVAYIADASTGRKAVMDYFFSIRPNATIGTITSVVLGDLILSQQFATTFTGFNNYYRTVKTCAHLYRLQDGGWIVSMGGQFEMFVGDGRAPAVVLLYDANGNKVGHHTYWTNATVGDTMFGTKELGYGAVQHTATAEGMYLSSWGNTVDSILKTIAGQRTAEQFVIVLSRTDAGDNVSISQFAASRTRDKILSLIPPSRKVQGMDLTQDRTITRAMLANADRIPNQRDSTYPVQQKHRDSLSVSSLSNHTHPAGDFTMAGATQTTYGASQAAPLTGAAGSAVSVGELDTLEQFADTMFSRTVTNRVLDVSMTIDYEV